MQSTLLGYECWFSNNILTKNLLCPSIACCYLALQRLQGASSILNHSTKCQKTCFTPRAQVTLSAQRDHTGERVMAVRRVRGGRMPGKVRSEQEQGKEGSRAAHPGNTGIRTDYRTRQLLLTSSQQR